MAKVIFDNAKEWLENLSSDDRVAVIHDVDTDGMCSTVLLTDYLDKKGIFWEHFCFYRGVSTLKDFDLESFDKFVVQWILNSL